MDFLPPSPHTKMSHFYEDSMVSNEGSTGSTTRGMTASLALLQCDATTPDAPGSKAQHQLQECSADACTSATPDTVISRFTENGITSLQRREMPWGVRKHVTRVEPLECSSDEEDPLDDGAPSDSFTRLLFSRSCLTRPARPFCQTSSFTFGSSSELQPISNTGTTDSDHKSLDGTPSDSFERLRKVRRAACARSLRS